ncbi:hypothetical protein BJ987_003307 [Nocardia goodfellowii]|uniref:Uncharacterized protein n=1 Tax=Nocardia goodfellowii TaxID=882446 RepID=A0ABS4QIC4_9NOCA|nr:hypothetical protein [Nocardia goodfellowii]
MRASAIRPRETHPGGLLAPATVGVATMRERAGLAQWAG